MTILVAVLLAGCGGGASTPSPAAAPAAKTVATTAPPTTQAPRHRSRPAVHHQSTPSATPTTAAPVATPRATHHHRVVTPSLLVDRLVGVGNAHQVIAVTSGGYGTSYAELQAFQRTSNGWRKVFGTWPARIGYNGFAPSGRKREGDGRTPSGSFGFQFMFGVNPDPGVRFAYRRALSTSTWDDDPASSRYNEWVDTRTADPGRSPESMRQVPAYLYGVVIAYNTARTPGLGSAIFLHVAHVGATSGCVSIPESELLAVLRWLDPAQHPRIVMGPTAAVTH